MRRAWLELDLRAALALALLSGPSVAQAANEAHVRTPVLWPSECGRVVDRSVDPVTVLDYDIPAEDLELGPDELPDSRTHQFVGFCRQHPDSELLPPWIARDDVDRSVEAGIISAGEVTYREILDESSVWTDCFTRITPDDGRRAISFEVAAAGVSWDTSAVPAGVWSVSGYTFEPPFNLWSDRPGFIKIVDDRGDPAQDLPALALLGPEQVVAVHEMLELEACADFLGPAELELEWAELAPSLDWQPLATFELSEDNMGWSPAVRAPPEAEGLTILVRGTLVDAMGRRHEAHAPGQISVEACPPEGCPPPPSETAPNAHPSCSLAVGPGAGSPLTWLLVVLLGLLRPKMGRRRRIPA